MFVMRFFTATALFRTSLSRFNASVLSILKLSALFSSPLYLLYRHSAPSVCERFTHVDSVVDLASSRR